MCFDGPSAEREPEAQAGSIGSALLERAEQFVNVPAWESAAFVLHRMITRDSRATPCRRAVVSERSEVEVERARS